VLLPQQTERTTPELDAQTQAVKALASQAKAVVNDQADKATEIRTDLVTLKGHIEEITRDTKRLETAVAQQVAQGDRWELARAETRAQAERALREAKNETDTIRAQVESLKGLR
jgi:hypothetical protein